MVGAEFTNTDRRPRRMSHGRWRGSGRTSAANCRGIRSRRRAAWPESAVVVTVKVASSTRHSSRSTLSTPAAEAGWAQTDAAREARGKDALHGTSGGRAGAPGNMGENAQDHAVLMNKDRCALK